MLAENDYPGWQARVDGRSTPVVQADGSFQAVAVPAGEHVVRFAYRPTSVRLGLAATVLGLAVAGGLWWLPGPLGRRRRRAPASIATFCTALPPMEWPTT